MFASSPFTFGERFLEDHAGQIITEPRIALVELVANAYDAGASQVDITWPEKDGDLFAVSDDGHGMSPDEFARRWRQFSYNRREEQGEDVQFPKNAKKKANRKAFGQSGKGRHGAFCFDDEYHVETRKDGKLLRVKVKFLKQADRPFDFEPEEVVDCDADEHGTRIFGVVKRNRIAVSTVKDAIGSKFIVDPSFTISINGYNIQLVDLTHLTTTTDITAETGQVVTVHRIDAPSQDRTTKLRGITWWVNGKMVGLPSWEGLDKQGVILDGRTQAAKRHSFVVIANCLNDVKHRKPDWEGFYETREVLAIKKAVREHIVNEINGILADARKERKLSTLGEYREALRELPRVSQEAVGQFIDEVQQSCPSLTDTELSKAVEVFTKLEQARSGYDLLHKLADCSPTELDKWNRLMEEWTVDRAEIVLAELKRRLDLIAELQKRVNDKTSDELHELQPLFAEGLWIFGPEYDSPDFIANRQMATVLTQLLKVQPLPDVTERRPDFVVLPDRSLSVFAADGYADGEVTGFRKILVLELKRGGFALTNDEMQQGQRYAHELRKTPGVSASTTFQVFVLGSFVGDAEEIWSGKNREIHVLPMCFEAVLRRAQARTFNLQKKLEAVKPVKVKDQEVAQVVTETQADMFR